MKRICIICARGGSKGVLGKNLRPLAGRPLIHWTIGHALEADLFAHVAVSSEDPRILEEARAGGATLIVKRPPELATDTASVLPAIAHALATAEADLGIVAESFVYLQPTSPLRESADILRAVALFAATRPGSVVSGTPARNSPYYTIVERRADETVTLAKTLKRPLARRQDGPACFDLNGSIYVFDRNRFLAERKVLFEDTRLYEMPPERSVDIDTELDWRLADLLMAERRKVVP